MSGKTSIRDQLLSVAYEIERMLERDPLAIINESELQALLHDRLLAACPETPNLRLASDVINPRRNASYTCRRVYRELKTSPGRTGKETDLVVLTEGTQTLHAKKNGAPSMFGRPYAAIIEVKVDASTDDIMHGTRSRTRNRAVVKDLGKWDSIDDGTEIFSVVYTDRPDLYGFDDRIVFIKRPSLAVGAVDKLPSDSSVGTAAHAYPEVLKALRSQFVEQPYWFLREKDFETALFTGLRQSILPRNSGFDPVRTQLQSPNVEVLGKRRRHDLVIAHTIPGRLVLELELKTSHSMHHNWFRKGDVVSEFDAMQRLRVAGLLDHAVFTLFRIGSRRWQEDADALARRFPLVEIDYICSEVG